MSPRKSEVVGDSKSREHFSLSRTVRVRPPALPFDALARKILGTGYSVSLVFIGEERSRVLNETYRGNKKPANVLSFPLSKNEGEILINPQAARKSARDFNENYTWHVARLFIHGMLHLKGLRHGSTMERRENELLREVIKK